ncbi:MAG: hypothetical protein IPK53_12030 [bacterium]|nr:hypothetical protein [bacterium]
MVDKTQVLPFGLDSDEYSALLDTNINGQLSTNIVVQLSTHDILPYDLNLRKEIKKALDPVLQILDDSPMPTGYGRVMIDFDVVPYSNRLHELLGPAQREWLVNGRYVQVGFSSAEVVYDSPISGPIAASLTLYDFLVERHGSLDPGDHQPIEIPYNVVRQLRINMNDVYRHDLTVLPRELLSFRNKVAVMARAALAGKDPVDAYDNFLEESHSYLLEIPLVDGYHPRDLYTIRGLAFVAENYPDMDYAVRKALAKLKLQSGDEPDFITDEL